MIGFKEIRLCCQCCACIVKWVHSMTVDVILKGLEGHFIGTLIKAEPL